MARKRQQRIPGTFDKATKEVHEAAEDYVTLLTTRMKAQERENVARGTLLEKMQAADVTELDIDGYKVTRVHLEEEKIKVKKTEMEADSEE